jgi:putative cardiolipin synthase
VPKNRTFLAFLFFAGCSSLPTSFPASPSHAISPLERTTLRDLLQPGIVSHLGKSGFSIVNTGRDAILTRLALADVAEKSIDAQYFIWEGDSSGLLLIDRLIKAADRGVRVRLLLDDMTSHGKDLGLAVLNQHPQIEVRVFNPLGRRYYMGIFRTVAIAFHVGRMTNRMHNKIFVIDNQAALVGGRNIGDDYFGVAKKSNFRDLDLVTCGPIVGDISDAFDLYWNSPWAVPFELFKTKIPSGQAMDKRYRKLKEGFFAAEKIYPYPLDWRQATVIKRIQDDREKLIWADAEVVSDAPDKAWTKARRGESKSEIVRRLSKIIGQAEKELVVVSPYLIFSEESAKRLGHYTQKGVSVKILTNSLASTDALPVVAMYRPIREDILRSGAQLFEMRPDAASRERHIDPSRTKSRLSLHAKAALIDGKDVFIGTFNVDPRSEHLNTEVGLLVHSPALAQALRAELESDLSPENSYSLQWDGEEVSWTSRTRGSAQTFSSDPHAGFWRRLSAFFLSLLPIKNQL